MNQHTPTSPRGAKSPARRKCHRDGCPAWHVRSPRTNRCIHRKKQTYQDVCKSPRKKAKPSSPKKAKKASPIVKLLDNIEDVTPKSEIIWWEHKPIDPSAESTWFSLPKVLRSGSRTFVPTKMLGQGSFGVVFAYKEEGEEKQPDTSQNTIALKLVNGKSAKDSDCQGTLDYFPKAKNISQICKGVIYQRCISSEGLPLPPYKEYLSPDDIFVHQPEDPLSFYIVMELMDGDFFQIQDRLTPQAKKKVVLGLKEALVCLLKHKRYYVDLKEDNVFFNYSKHYKGSGPVNSKDIGSIKLGDLGSICKKNEIKPAYFIPPSHWEAFGGIGWKAPCTEDTTVWQLATLVYELYTGQRVGGLEEDERDFIQDRLTRLRNELTSKNFPKLPISKFKEVFDLDFDNLQKNKNRVQLKSLFS